MSKRRFEEENVKMVKRSKPSIKACGVYKFGIGNVKGVNAVHFGVMWVPPKRNLEVCLSRIAARVGLKVGLHLGIG